MRPSAIIAAIAGLAAGVVAAIVTVAIASLSYFAIERPMLSLKRLVRAPRPDEEPREAIAEPAPAPPPVVNR